MRVVRKRKVLIFVLLMLIALPAFPARQEPKALLATANGNGTIKIGQEEFKIHSVVIKLLEDGKLEITLVTEITIFVSGTWSRGDDSQNIKLEITGGASSSIEASGKLLLRNDGKSIDRLWLQGVIKTRNRSIEISFQAQ
jgi:hypothetical protein